MTPLHPNFWLGADQFNNREFYACHDTFEAIWMETLDDRTFYQGLLQIAVALYHLSNLNWQGATTLLGEGTGRLRPYLPEYEGIDVAQVCEQAQAILARLYADGKPAVAQSAAAVIGLVSTDPTEKPALSGTLPLPKIRKVAES
ncbi:MAG: DUF309 domain-containing protein [Synechococcales cyanobacterium RU_4_20]|nr:DUF309 domain-containing protein [Synechococcales cyanobacterium RU_4_20]NJR67688.1 DUF309 domain-containing protein [Synechococcales cyanobacterium CRU_2_2]